MSLFAQRDFVRYQGVRLCSVIAIQTMHVAIAWEVYARTHDPLALGLVGLAQFAPQIALALITGDVADRFDRRNILIACHALVMLCALGLAALVAIPGTPVEAIYGVLVLFGAARSFAGPAAQAMVPSLVPAPLFPRAVAAGSTVFQVANIAGPPVGGAIHGLIGGPGVLLLAATIQLFALGLLFSMEQLGVPRRVHDPSSSGLSRLLAGVRYVRDHRVILGAISLDLFAVLLGGAVALMPYFADEIFHTDAVGLGLLRGAPALGALTMAVILARWPLERRAGWIMLGCVALFGVATIVFGLSTSLPLSLAALAVLGAADMVSVVLRGVVVQVSTPPEMRGRVAAVNLVFIGASNELGEFESGTTARLFGVVPAVVAGGLGTLLVVALWAWRFPELRDVDRPEDHDVMRKPSAPPAA